MTLTPDERMAAALDRIKASIAEGLSVDEVLEQAANEHGFSLQAVTNRATKRFGDLTKLKAILDRRAENVKRQHGAESAIEAYLVQQPEKPFSEWFERRVGRNPTDDEQNEFSARHRRLLINRIKKSDIKISI